MRLSWAVAVAVFLVVGLGLLALLPSWVVPALSTAELAAEGVEDPSDRLGHQTERLTVQNAVRATLLQALGGVALVAGAVTTWRTLNVNRRKAETERFAQAATDLLGHDRKSVRAAGVFALERMVADGAASVETVVDLLCACIREHAALSGAVVRRGQSGRVRAFFKMEKPRREGGPEPLCVRAPDVQAALTVLGRLDRSEDTILQLSHVDLRCADLVNANLARADLKGSDLSRSMLYGANLQRTDLGGVHLTGANLLRANLHRADLAGADLSECKLRPLERVPGGFAVPDTPHEDDAILQEAVAERGSTRWPSDFDFDTAGVDFTRG